MDELSLDTTTPEIPYRFAKDHQVVVFKVLTTEVKLKCTQNTSLQALSEINSCFARPLIIERVSIEELDIIISDIYGNSSTASSALAENIDDNYDLTALAENLPQTSDLLDTDNDAPVIKLINAILSEAIKASASDIHIEPFENYLSIRFRVDGVLQEILKPSEKMAPMINARIKVMSQLDIAEKRIPQDGRMSLQLGKKWIDIRVSTLPSSFGERLVLRILDKAETQLGLEQLGMSSNTLSQVKKILKKQNGIVLVSGPTGSGKTTTLYSALNILNDKTRNILTVEDPIEYGLEGVGQTQVNTKVGMTFARGLRAILRQDPDVVMVGEIRDLETAEISIQASLTGHLVLSTVHTNDSVGVVTRLRDMGIESYLLSSSLKGVLAQRLVRRLCVKCKKQETVSDNVHLPDSSEVYVSVGCEECHETGYLGRIGLFEFFSIDDMVKEAINSNASEEELTELSFSEENRLFESGLELVMQGLTSLDEVLRVTKEL
ncbi:MAG: type II secretion system ATPase GspE [SAR86 cluster bacterium]|jgi:general secretion pathway protein E|nr:type II secretion system ATPase GspE [SAR86 cluster bacterium]